MDFLRPLFGRIIGGLVAGFAVFLSTKYGIQLTQESQAQIVSVAFTIGTIVYAVVHKSVDSKINPLDAARPATAIAGKVAADDIANASISHLDTLPQHVFSRGKE